MTNTDNLHSTVYILVGAGRPCRYDHISAGERNNEGSPIQQTLCIIHSVWDDHKQVHLLQQWQVIGGIELKATGIRKVHDLLLLLINSRLSTTAITTSSQRKGLRSGDQKQPQDATPAATEYKNNRATTSTSTDHTDDRDQGDNTPPDPPNPYTGLNKGPHDQPITKIESDTDNEEEITQTEDNVLSDLVEDAGPEQSLHNQPITEIDSNTDNDGEITKHEDSITDLEKDEINNGGNCTGLTPAIGSLKISTSTNPHVPILADQDQPPLTKCSGLMASPAKKPSILT